MSLFESAISGGVAGPLRGVVAFAGDAGPKQRSGCGHESLVVNVSIEGARRELHFAVGAIDKSVGKFMPHARPLGAFNRNKVIATRSQANLRGLGLSDKYKLVLEHSVTHRVLKYGVRMREQSLRATEVMHTILSRQVRFECKICRERFAAFHPAYEPPEGVARSMDVLRPGRGGLAKCSVAVYSWDELPVFDDVNAEGLASHSSHWRTPALSERHAVAIEGAGRS